MRAPLLVLSSFASLALGAACSDERGRAQAGPATAASSASFASFASSASSASSARAVAAPSAPTCPPLARLEIPAPIATADDPKPVALDDPGAKGMERFYEKLAALLRGRARDHLRVAFIGDSNTTMDYLTSALRRPLQKRFGDAGHGFVALAKPWGDYLHQDVRHDLVADVWSAHALAYDKLEDGIFGFGGIAAVSRGAGAKTWVATAREGAPLGTRIDRFDVWYATGSVGGTFDVKLDGKPLARVDTKLAQGALPGVEARTFEIADGAHAIDFVANNGGVRLLGATLERSPKAAGGASVVVDCLGADSLNYRLLGLNEPRSFSASLRRRGYDLVVVWLGTNVCILPPHDGWMRGAIDAFRAALPDAAILIVGPPDRSHARSGSDREVETKACSAAEQRIAHERGVAFWGFQEAMGGEGSVFGFYRRGLVSGDRLHLTPKGAELMGGRLLAAISAGFEAWSADHERAGCSD